MDQHSLWANKLDCCGSGAAVDSGVLLDCWTEGARLCGEQNIGRTRSCSNDCLKLGKGKEVRWAIETRIGQRRGSIGIHERRARALSEMSGVLGRWDITIAAALPTKQDSVVY